MATLVCTGNYREDLATAKKLGIIKGNPKKDVLYNAIQQYEIENDNISEGQKISEIALVDELINACNDSTEKGDLPLLPKPILKANKKPVPMPVKKNNFRVKPDAPKLKPVNIDTVLRRKPAPPRLKGSGDIMLPKLGNRFNRSLFQ
jgi:hypothetical protein